MQVNWNELKERAERMSEDDLRYAIVDCVEAGDAAWKMEQSGLVVSKTQGYYLDEASIYRAEIRRREASK